MRPVRRAAHRKSPREIAMRPRGVLQESVPQPAHQVREASSPAAVPEDCELTGHRAIVLREARREDAYRDINKRHAAVGKLVLLAVHGDHVTFDVASVGGRLILALRLAAVPAEPAIRSLPKVSEGRPSVRRRGHVVQ